MKEKEQIIHWINEFTKLANGFWDKNEDTLYEYWKGQVMGICKVVDLLKLDINTEYYLNQLH